MSENLLEFFYKLVNFLILSAESKNGAQYNMGSMRKVFSKVITLFPGGPGGPAGPIGPVSPGGPFSPGAPTSPVPGLWNKS